MEEGYIQMANVLHQRPSTALESSNLVCKSMRIKCNPDTWVLCLQTLHSFSVSPCSSGDLRTSYEDGDREACRWAEFVDAPGILHSEGLCCKNKWL